MKRVLNKAIIVMVILATIMSLPAMSVNAATKIEDNVKWFFTNSYYIKSISIPLDYYNYKAEFYFTKNHEKYTQYYIYQVDTYNGGQHLTRINLQRLGVKDIKIKFDYDKSIIDVKAFKKSDYPSDFTDLLIKPIKKGSTNLKITYSAKGFQTYTINTKINVLGTDKTIETKTGISDYYQLATKSRNGFGFVSEVIKDLKLKDKSLYEKVTYVSKWCIDNYSELEKIHKRSNPHIKNDNELKEGFKNYMNNLFSEFMKELNIPYYRVSPYSLQYPSYNLILMNNDKWYMVDVNKASYTTVKEIENQIEETIEEIKNIEADWENEKKIGANEDPFTDDDYYKEMISSGERQLTELKEKLKQVKAGIPVDLTYTLVSPYKDNTYSKKTILLDREFATDDLLNDPNKTQKTYVGKLAQFTEDKITINLLHSYNKKVKLPIKLNGTKADDINIKDKSFYSTLVENAMLNGIQIYANNSGSTLLEADLSSVISDKNMLEVEIIEPSLDGNQYCIINNAKIGSKKKIPLANANFADFNIKSENTKVATVSANGVITAKSNGRTTIVLQSKTNSKFKLYVNIGVGKRYY